MDKFVFTRESKESTINSIDLKNIKLEVERLKEEYSKWIHELKYGSKPVDFEVGIRPLKRQKSFKQLRGYYRLINILLPVIKEQNPDHFIDIDVVDNIIKDRYGYYTQYEGIKTYKSKAKATIEDMIGLIKTAEVLGAFYSIEDCHLSSDEERELKEYYNK